MSYIIYLTLHHGVKVICELLYYIFDLESWCEGHGDQTGI